MRRNEKIGLVYQERLLVIKEIEDGEYKLEDIIKSIEEKDKG